MKGRSGGFTLIELIVATAVVALVAAAASPAIFTVLTGTERNNHRVTALTQVQNAGAQISRDALQATSLAVSGSTGFPVTLSWGDLWLQEERGGTTWVSNDHFVTYAMVGNELERQERLVTTVFDSTGQQQGPAVVSDTNSLIAQYLTAASASWSNKVLSLSVTARFPLAGERYVIEETRNYEIRPRPQ